MMHPARPASKTPKGGKTLARGNAPGAASPKEASPKWARETLDQCETGEKLLAAVLSRRERDHHGVGKYRQPVEPATDELPELPSHWIWASPDQLSAASRNSMAIGPFGSNLKVSDYREEGVPLVFVRHIRAESFTETHYVTPGKAKELAAHSVAGGDLLITKMGEPPGDSAIYPVGAPNAIITADCIKWRLAAAGLDPKFFKYALRTETTKEQIAKRTRGVAQKKVSLERFKDMALPFPPLPEQRRIVARIEEIFSRLDAGVASLRQAKAQLQRYRQSVLAAAVTGQLTQAWREQNPHIESAEELLQRILERRREQWNGRRKYNEPIAPAVADLPEIPASWTWSSPAQLSASEDYSLAIGPFGSNLKVSDYADAGVPLVFVRHIRANDYELTPKFVSAEKASELRAHSVDPGDLLVTKMGEPPGDAALYPENRPHAVITADCIKLRLTHLIASKLFFVNAINSQLVAKQIAPITRGVAQKKISLDRFRDIALPLPPLAEQHQIVAEVEARTTAIDHLEAELDLQDLRSSQLRQAILKAAFAGHLYPEENYGI